MHVMFKSVGSVRMQRPDNFRILLVKAMLLSFGVFSAMMVEIMAIGVLMLTMCDGCILKNWAMLQLCILPLPIFIVVAIFTIKGAFRTFILIMSSLVLIFVAGILIVGSACRLPIVTDFAVLSC